MGTTRAFKNVRLLVHLFTLIIIIGNIVLLALFYIEVDFFSVETTLNLGIFNLQSSFKYTSVIHIILSFFSSCSINSKIKFYVRLYLILGFVTLCVLMGIFIFVATAYKKIFDKQFSYQIGQNTTIRYLVRGLFNCSEYGSKDCLAVMKDKVDYMIKIYIVISSVSFVLALIVYILGRIVVFIDVSVPDKKLKIPKMTENVRMGYDSGSLRQRKILDPHIRCTTSVLNSAG